MAQFLKVKEQYPDSLLFYRMGDFYELFFEDAIKASSALGITLTKRGQHSGEDIPMCGVPAHASENYLLELIRKGFKVAVCEQMESPLDAKKRGPKSVVKREVVRLVTPGTLTEESLLDSSSNNFLLAFSEIRSEGSIAWVDMSTGTVTTTNCPRSKLLSEISRLSPSELLVIDNGCHDIFELLKETQVSITSLGKSSFESASAEKRLKAIYGVNTLDAFGSFSRSEISAMGALIDYLDITQKGHLPFLKIPFSEKTNKILQIDPATRKNLELLKNLQGEKTGTLLSVINKTKTAAGARLLESWVSSPSTDLKVIDDRSDSVSLFHNNFELLETVRKVLKTTPDLERVLSRLSLDRSGPRDLSAIRDSLINSELLNNFFSGVGLPKLLKNAFSTMSTFTEIMTTLSASLTEEPPHLIRDGGFIKQGYSKDLDQSRVLRDDSRKIIANLQLNYIEKTSISSLKIKYNKVLGYFIETTSNHSEKMFSSEFSDLFIHRQTTANSVRFTTVELSNLENSILNAANEISAFERALFTDIRALVLSKIVDLKNLATMLATVDVLSSLAALARDNNWTKPAIDMSRDFKIIDGRHPVVESSISALSENRFIANSCNLTADKNSSQIWVLTGPNMSGKSTFLRQNALIAILAQIGSYVPAKEAKIGLLSQVFSRVGASDDLARGRSTFMVEMVETAAILNQADERALVILDEIGRGTATYDGLSIAWATLEHLHNKNRCRALFATHYHELTATSDQLDGVQNATVSVKEWNGEIVFLHTVVKGSADRSYGVQVAKLAGLPKSVIKRAQNILTSLEGASKNRSISDDLPLFSQTLSNSENAEKRDLLRLQLTGVNPDNLTPKEALELVYKLKEIYDEDETPT